MGNGYVKKKSGGIRVTQSEDQELNKMNPQERTESVRTMLDYNPGSNLKGVAAKAKEVEFTKKVDAGNKLVHGNVQDRNESSDVRPLVRDMGKKLASNRIVVSKKS